MKVVMIKEREKKKLLIINKQYLHVREKIICFLLRLNNRTEEFLHYYPTWKVIIWN